MSNIYTAMAAIQKEFPAVPKEGINPSMKYKFRGIDDAMKALNPLLSKHGVFIVPQEFDVTLSDGGSTGGGKNQIRAVLRGKVRWYAADGTYIESAIIGEGIDTGDKAVMKCQANAMKYLIYYTFTVPTEEKRDSESFAD